MKFCINKKNASNIQQIIDDQVKVRWEEWSEDTSTLIYTLIVFDFLFYNPNGESDFEEKRPEWKDCILPRMKSSGLVFLFTSEWYEILYDRCSKAFYFVVCDRPPELSDDTNMFAATVGLTYPMRVALVSLLRLIRTMQQITEDLEQKVRIPFEMTMRAKEFVSNCTIWFIRWPKKSTCGRKGSTSCWTQICVKIVSWRKIECISRMITKQPETGFQGKNVIWEVWEAADIPVRLGTLVTCIKKSSFDT